MRPRPGELGSGFGARQTGIPCGFEEERDAPNRMESRFATVSFCRTRAGCGFAPFLHGAEAASDCQKAASRLHPKVCKISENAIGAESSAFCTPKFTGQPTEALGFLRNLASSIV